MIGENAAPLKNGPLWPDQVPILMTVILGDNLASRQPVKLAEALHKPVAAKMDPALIRDIIKKSAFAGLTVF